MEQFLQQYSQQAMNTAIYPNVGGNLSYPSKALVDEWGEIAEKIWGFTPPFSEHDLQMEFGDGYWEANALSQEMGYSFSELIMESADMYVQYEHADDLVKRGYLLLSNVMGRLKKFERDGSAQQLVRARLFLVQFFAVFGALVNGYGFELQDILEMNLAKLSDRQDRNVLGGDGDNR